MLHLRDSVPTKKDMVGLISRKDLSIIIFYDPLCILETFFKGFILGVGH